MAKEPVRWDTYNPNAPAPSTDKPKPSPRDLAWGAKNAPGPQIAQCDECGADANPCWTEGSMNFCRTCVPRELRHPNEDPAR